MILAKEWEGKLIHWYPSQSRSTAMGLAQVFPWAQLLKQQGEVGIYSQGADGWWSLHRKFPIPLILRNMGAGVLVFLILEDCC